MKTNLEVPTAYEYDITYIRVGKNIDNWRTRNNGKTKREHLAYNVKDDIF